MTVLIIALFVLLLLGIAFLVIRAVARRRTTQRRPRARDLVPAHLQARKIDNALIRHLVRRERVQGVTPAGVAVRREIRKAGRSR